MQKAKSILTRTIPVLLVVIVIIIMALFVYNRMMVSERNDCWDRLDLATRSMADRVSMGFTSHLQMLTYVADALVLTENFGEQVEVQAFLSKIQENPDTMFERIDIVYPDGIQLTQTGERFPFQGTDTFTEMISRGTHISPRLTDDHTGREVVYLCTPIEVNGKVAAMLMGMIDCGDMEEEFVSYSYSGRVMTLLVDRADGNYLINPIQDSLGNVYAEKVPRQPSDYQDNQFQEEITAGKTGNVAYYSTTTRQLTYIFYMPVPDMNWSVAIAVEDEIVFEDVYAARTMLTRMGIALFCLLVFYVVWNILMMRQILKSEEQTRLAEMERSRNAAKSFFLSSISHDIRTPLNGIIGMLEVIRLRGDIPGHMEDPLQKIDTSAKYLLSLASDVLDVNELEAGKVVIACEPMDLAQLAREISTIVEPKAQKREILFTMDYTALQHTRVLGSEVHLSKILINLIGNAIKYNRTNGQVQVSMEEEVQSAQTSLFRFVVQDNGIGMTEEFQKYMFHAFEQENASARTVYTGHGLGLFIVKQLVDKMNGTITVNSIRDIGTTITVTLPLPLLTAEESQRQTVSAGSELDGIHILMAEDNELNREIVKVMLLSAGAVITETENGKEALAQFRDNPAWTFDAILMDIMMPEMDGHEATRQIRALDKPDAAAIPIIAMTAGTFSEDIQKYRAEGMHEHIAKPLDRQTLLVKLERLCTAYREKYPR